MGVFSFLDGMFKRRNTPVGSRQVEEDRKQLRAEQRILADDIEALFRRFDTRLQELALRAHHMSEADFDRQASVLREAQTQLRMALRRLESSFKTTRELERELGEWEAREDAGALHPDHPRVRAEMVRSELAVRGFEREITHASLKEYVASRLKETCPSCEATARQTPKEEAFSEIIAVPVYEFRSWSHIPSVDGEVLVHAIRDATRETEQWHAIPASLHDQETIDQVHHLRELHAALKRLDRQQGVRRDRLALAVHVREVQ